MSKLSSIGFVVYCGSNHRHEIALRAPLAVTGFFVAELSTGTPSLPGMAASSAALGSSFKLSGTQLEQRQHPSVSISISTVSISSWGQASTSRAGRTLQAGFRERLQRAWHVLVDGSPSPSVKTARLKRRSSTLLIADRGFDSDSLSHFYSLAKEAIAEHVVLEAGEQQQERATVESLGELQFQFNVRRIRSSAEDEPWARPSLVEYEPGSPV